MTVSLRALLRLISARAVLLMTNAASLALALHVGSIPSELHGLVSLESLALAGNQLTGVHDTGSFFITAESLVLIVDWRLTYFAVVFSPRCASLVLFRSRCVPACHLRCYYSNDCTRRGFVP